MRLTYFNEDDGLDFRPFGFRTRLRKGELRPRHLALQPRKWSEMRSHLTEEMGIKSASDSPRWRFSPPICLIGWNLNLTFLKYNYFNNNKKTKL